MLFLFELGNSQSSRVKCLGSFSKNSDCELVLLVLIKISVRGDQVKAGLIDQETAMQATA